MTRASQGSSTGENPAAGSALAGTPVWDDHERAALVALLRARLGGLTWSEIAADVADARSARSVWDQHHSPDLFTDGTPSPMWLAALAEVEHWKNADFQFLTFMDDAYPQQLLEVHQFPPVLFVKGPWYRAKSVSRLSAPGRHRNRRCAARVKSPSC
jgi:DNA processing protein